MSKKSKRVKQPAKMTVQETLDAIIERAINEVAQRSPDRTWQEGDVVTLLAEGMFDVVQARDPDRAYTKQDAWKMADEHVATYLHYHEPETDWARMYVAARKKKGLPWAVPHWTPKTRDEKFTTLSFGLGDKETTKLRYWDTDEGVVDFSEPDLEAAKIVRTCEAEHRRPTAEERAVVARWRDIYTKIHHWNKFVLSLLDDANAQFASGIPMLETVIRIDPCDDIPMENE